jgi:hypothetical protein
MSVIAIHWHTTVSDFFPHSDPDKSSSQVVMLFLNGALTGMRFPYEPPMPTLESFPFNGGILISSPGPEAYPYLKWQMVY